MRYPIIAIYTSLVLIIIIQTSLTKDMYFLLLFLVIKIQLSVETASHSKMKLRVIYDYIALSVAK